MYGNAAYFVHNVLALRKEGDLTVIRSLVKTIFDECIARAGERSIDVLFGTQKRTSRRSSLSGNPILFAVRVSLCPRP